MPAAAALAQAPNKPLRFFPDPSAPQAGCLQGGVLTPATAMGLVLADRLRAAGIIFDIVQSPALSSAKEPALSK